MENGAVLYKRQWVMPIPICVLCVFLCIINRGSYLSEIVKKIVLG